MSLLLALAPSERPMYDMLLHGYQDLYAPATPFDEDRVRELSWLEVRLDQARMMETAFIEFRIKSQLDAENLTTPRDPDHANSLWGAVITGTDFPRLRSLWQRQDRLSRQIDRLRKQLHESLENRELAEMRRPGRPRVLPPVPAPAGAPQPTEPAASAIPTPVPAPETTPSPDLPESAPSILRRGPCPCGSGRRYKNCCESRGKQAA